MKENFQAGSRIHTRRIEPGDLDAWRDFCSGLPDPGRYEKYWKDDGALLFRDESDVVMFGLWDGGRMIGQTAIAFDPDNRDGLAVFCETEIDPAFRGRGYAGHLYEARKRYLEEAGFKGGIETHIRPDNLPSLKAAARNGFYETGEMFKGYCVLKSSPG